jgi:hypothetical protein
MMARKEYEFVASRTKSGKLAVAENELWKAREELQNWSAATGIPYSMFTFTFCNGPTHQFSHGYTIIPHFDHAEARAKMVEMFGTDWAFQYATEELAGVRQHPIYFVPWPERKTGVESAG